MASTPPPQCVLDRSVINEKTVGELTDMGLSFFAPLCGKNRGAFVTDPPDGHTYGCLIIPQAWGEVVGLNDNVTMADSNDIKNQFAAQNTTATETVELLDLLVKAVYQSSANQKSDPYACDAGGLAELQCGNENDAKEPIRAVTLNGLFIPFLGANKTLEEAQTFYTPQDFADMKAMGLNTVQIPVPLDSFEHSKVAAAVKTVMDMAKDLDVIITLMHGNDDVTTAVIAAATFCASHKVKALTLPEKSMVPAARGVAPDLTLFVVIDTGDFIDLEFGDDPNVFGSLNMDHSSSVSDVASSDSLNDRLKLFYHENVACVSRSSLEYAKCIRKVPVFISGGFDLSIDDCVKKHIDAKQFRDYGQCDRFNETVGSGWWNAHRASFAARQVFAYERGMGWSYTTWKVDNNDYAKHELLDEPVKLLSLKNVHAAGLFPTIKGSTTAVRACLNPPEVDFVLGDATLAPSEAPPPDCGNGWWNVDTKQCDYWVPPVPAPTTMAPTRSCPTCEVCPPSPSFYTVDMVSGAIGCVVGLIVGAILMKVYGKRDQGYSTIPN
jgi:hypothetical protein